LALGCDLSERFKTMLEDIPHSSLFHAILAEDQITHEISLDDAPDPQTGLDVFKVDPEYDEHEKQYKAIMREILGEDEGSDDGEGGKAEGGKACSNCVSFQLDNLQQ
jgi:hypothetical protein